MPKSDRPFPDPPRRRIGIAQFMLAQLLTAAVAIAGVYLAAERAFDQTTRQTRYDDATDTVHMLHAVSAELSDNIIRVEAFAAYVEGMADNGRLDPTRFYSLDHTSFDAAPENGQYFRLGADIIVGVRRFYRATDALETDLTGIVTRGGTVPGGSVKRHVGTRLSALRIYIEKMRESLLPRIAKRVSELEAARRDAYGDETVAVPIAQPLELPELSGAINTGTGATTPGSSGGGGGGGPDSPGRGRPGG